MTLPSQIYGPGTNLLPMLHVSDLAKYVAEVEACSEEMHPYLLVSDNAQSTQADILKAISMVLGAGEVRPPTDLDSLIENPAPAHLTLNLCFTTTKLPDSCHYVPEFKEGMIANIKAVAAEWKTWRGVTPLRVMLVGPPMAGKSALGARLAHRCEEGLKLLWQ
jgi:adenylate kinase